MDGLLCFPYDYCRENDSFQQEGRTMTDESPPMQLRKMGRAVRDLGLEEGPLSYDDYDRFTACAAISERTIVMVTRATAMVQQISPDKTQP
jgi:hypothetical protein